MKAAGFDGGEEARQQEDVSHVLKSEVIEAEGGLVNPFPTSNYTIRGISAKGRRGKKEQPLFRRLPPSTAEEPARTNSEEEPAYANTTVASPEEVAESKGEGEEEAARVSVHVGPPVVSRQTAEPASLPKVPGSTPSSKDNTLTHKHQTLTATSEEEPEYANTTVASPEEVAESKGEGEEEAAKVSVHVGPLVVSRQTAQPAGLPKVPGPTPSSKDDTLTHEHQTLTATSEEEPVYAHGESEEEAAKVSVHVGPPVVSRQTAVPAGLPKVPGSTPSSKDNTLTHEHQTLTATSEEEPEYANTTVASPEEVAESKGEGEEEAAKVSVHVGPPVVSRQTTEPAGLPKVPGSTPGSKDNTLTPEHGTLTATSEEEPVYANTTVASPEEVAESKGEGEEEAAKVSVHVGPAVVSRQAAEPAGLPKVPGPTPSSKDDTLTHEHQTLTATSGEEPVYAHGEGEEEAAKVSVHVGPPVVSRQTAEPAGLPKVPGSTPSSKDNTLTHKHQTLTATSEEEPEYANTTVASPEEVAESKGEGEEEAAKVSVHVGPLVVSRQTAEPAGLPKVPGPTPSSKDNTLTPEHGTLTATSEEEAVYATTTVASPEEVAESQGEGEEEAAKVSVNVSSPAATRQTAEPAGLPTVPGSTPSSKDNTLTPEHGTPSETSEEEPVYATTTVSSPEEVAESQGEGEEEEAAKVSVNVSSPAATRQTAVPGSTPRSKDNTLTAEHGTLTATSEEEPVYATTTAASPEEVAESQGGARRRQQRCQ